MSYKGMVTKKRILKTIQALDAMDVHLTPEELNGTYG
jgi:hypothetical protein